MAQESIAFGQWIEMPHDILEQAKQMKPAGFNLNMLPPTASAKDIGAAMRDAEYLLGFLRFLPDEAYTEAKRVKLIQVLSAGYDMVNIEGARKARIEIWENGGAKWVGVAEQGIMVMVGVYRKLVTFHPNVVAGRWHKGIPRTVDMYEIEGKTVGLVGLGNIGRQVARRIKAFDANVIYYDPFRASPEDEAKLGVQYVPLDTLLETADIVTLHAPLNNDTRHMINAQSFPRMKPKAILINTCRAPLVDEPTLIEALPTGRILASRLVSHEKSPAHAYKPLLR